MTFYRRKLFTLFLFLLLTFTLSVKASVQKHQHIRITFTDGQEISYAVDDWTWYHKREGYEFYYCKHKKNPDYDIIHDWSLVWSIFEDIRRDYKEIVSMIKEKGHYAKYQDSIEANGRCTGWDANIQLLHSEISNIEIW